MNKRLGAVLFYSHVSSPTIPAPYLASLVTRTAALHISEECGVSPVSGCGETVPQGDDGRMSGHNGTGRRGDLQLSRDNNGGHHGPCTLPSGSGGGGGW